MNTCDQLRGTRTVPLGENYDHPGDLFARCVDCGTLYGCMKRECASCAETNLCHACAHDRRITVGGAA